MIECIIVIRHFALKKTYYLGINGHIIYDICHTYLSIYALILTLRDSLLIQLNSEKVANTRKYWRARPDRAEIFNSFWYWSLLRSLAVVNPTLYPI